MKKYGVTLSVIIVTWNSEQDIFNCLSSVYHSIGKINTEIIVVDNKSNDRSVQTIQVHFPNVRVLKQKINGGFGQGNNIGLRKAKGAYILLLNPDTIINAHSIHTMMRFLKTHPQTGVVGPEQFTMSNTMIFMASRLSILGIFEHVIEKTVNLLTRKNTILFPWPHKTYMLNAGCLLFRADLLPTRQWFDPDYFIYGEEHHVFKQIKSLKWDAYFLRNCSIYHHRETSIAQTGKKWTFTFNMFTTSLRKIIFQTTPLKFFSQSERQCRFPPLPLRLKRSRRFPAQQSVQRP